MTRGQVLQGLHIQDEGHYSSTHNLYLCGMSVAKNITHTTNDPTKADCRKCRAEWVKRNKGAHI